LVTWPATEIIRFIRGPLWKRMTARRSWAWICTGDLIVVRSRPSQRPARPEQPDTGCAGQQRRQNHVDLPPARPCDWEAAGMTTAEWRSEAAWEDPAARHRDGTPSRRVFARSSVAWAPRTEPSTAQLTDGLAGQVAEAVRPGRRGGPPRLARVPMAGLAAAGGCAQCAYPQDHRARSVWSGGGHGGDVSAREGGQGAEPGLPVLQGPAAQPLPSASRSPRLRAGELR
jgi:hypothetical protein